jgi:hypothetical protein
VGRELFGRAGSPQPGNRLGHPPCRNHTSRRCLGWGGDQRSRLHDSLQSGRGGGGGCPSGAKCTLWVVNCIMDAYIAAAAAFSGHTPTGIARHKGAQPVMHITFLSDGAIHNHEFTNGVSN